MRNVQYSIRTDSFNSCSKSESNFRLAAKEGEWACYVSTIYAQASKQQCAEDLLHFAVLFRGKISYVATKPAKDVNNVKKYANSVLSEAKLNIEVKNFIERINYAKKGQKND